MNHFKLRKKRRELDLSQRDFGEAIGKGESAYSRKENGRSEITLAEALAITIKGKLSFDEFNDIFFDGKLPFGNKSA